MATTPKVGRLAYHQPKPPPPEVLEKLERYTIDTDVGRVFGRGGKEVFTFVGNKGYHTMRILYGDGEAQRLRRAHVIWWAHYGEWPTQMLDHIDRDKTNDSIHNLRKTCPIANRLNTDYIEEHQHGN